MHGMISRACYPAFLAARDFEPAAKTESQQTCRSSIEGGDLGRFLEVDSWNEQHGFDVGDGVEELLVEEMKTAQVPARPSHPENPNTPTLKRPPSHAQTPIPNSCSFLPSEECRMFCSGFLARAR